MGLFGTSGIRRVADRDLLEIALRVGLGLGKLRRTAVVASDTRTSGGALKHAIVAGLMSAGAHCYDAGIVPTPTLAFAARDFEVGVMITASHNPPNYNGIKIFNSDGSSFDSTQQEGLERLLSGPPTTAPWGEMQEICQPYPEAVDKHMRQIAAHVRTSKTARVVLDCNCGAGSVITPFLFRKMGFEVVGINTHPGGFFPHDAEPVEGNLKDLATACLAYGAVGIAHDGDADRMMAVDEKGRFIPGDKLLVLLARHIGAKDVVTTVDASMIIEEQGLHTVRTKVGDTYVSEKLRTWGDFGGEPSGAWVFPKHSLCPDGIYAAAVLMSIASRESLASLVDSVPQYPIIRGAIPGTGSPANIDRISLEMKPKRIDDTDGAKLIFEDGWVLIRLSGTEPKIRITAEGKTETTARQLYDTAARLLAATPIGGRN